MARWAIARLISRCCRPVLRNPLARAISGFGAVRSQREVGVEGASTRDKVGDVLSELVPGQRVQVEAAQTTRHEQVVVLESDDVRRIGLTFVLLAFQAVETR